MLEANESMHRLMQEKRQLIASLLQIPYDDYESVAEVCTADCRNGKHTGCLQLLEILEISWNFIGPPGNFCVRCLRSTTLVSSHKNMDKYSLQKYDIYRHQVWFFKFFRCTKTCFRPGLCPGPLLGELMTLPQIPIRLGRAEIPSEGGQSKANMSWIFLKIPPGISWKSPGNLLD